METPALFLFFLAVGYLLYWSTMNDKRSNDKGDIGWFAIRPPKPRDPGRQPWSPHDHQRRP